MNHEHMTGEVMDHERTITIRGVAPQGRLTSSEHRVWERRLRVLRMADRLGREMPWAVVKQWVWSALRILESQ